MIDKETCEKLLGIDGLWSVESVELAEFKKKVTVTIIYKPEDGYRCPRCQRKSWYHDTQTREVKHFDIWDYKTWLKVKFPRVKCPACGVVPVKATFVAEKAQVTVAFKKRILDLSFGVVPVGKVAKDLGLDWHVVDRIKRNAMKAARDEQKKSPQRIVKRIGIDEKSFRGHNCVTIITDTVRKTVIAVIDGRDYETVKKWFRTQTVADFSKLLSISMDMAAPYLKAIREVFPNADSLICFDRFHVAQLFNRTVDKVRRRESAQYKKHENPLLRTRFDWLRNSAKTDNRTSRRRKFLELTRKPLQTAKAWKLKEKASRLWNYKREGSARKAWKQLVYQLCHARIEELKSLGKTLKNHLFGILNAIKLKANNALAEARNSCIQRIKMMACGYRNKLRFADEILFQYGGLKMTF